MGRRRFLRTSLRRVGDASTHVGEPGLRVDGVDLCGSDEGIDRHDPHVAAAVTGQIDIRSSSA